MPFNVEWAAKWSLMGITIEGCGKDLSTKGGSRDRSEAVSREVFDREYDYHYRRPVCREIFTSGIDRYGDYYEKRITRCN
jgi:lysyl-tRNA synthetase class I